jgi:hypothetical protein
MCAPAAVAAACRLPAWGAVCAVPDQPDERVFFAVGSTTSLYALAPPTSTQPNGCLAHSTTLGKEWSPCSKPPLNCTAANACNQLIVKDSKTMFMMRKVLLTAICNANGHFFCIPRSALLRGNVRVMFAFPIETKHSWPLILHIFRSKYEHRQT